MKKLLTVITLLLCLSAAPLALAMPIESEPPPVVDPSEPPLPAECYIDGVICYCLWDGKQVVCTLYPNWICP